MIHEYSLEYVIPTKYLKKTLTNYLKNTLTNYLKNTLTNYPKKDFKKTFASYFIILNFIMINIMF